MVKVTFTLDDETIAKLRRTAERHKKPQSWVVREAVADYAAKSDMLTPDEKARMLEGERILAAIPGGATVYALDEKGRSVTTQGLSVMLAGWMRDATHPLFVIGGADGLPEAVRSRAD